MNPLMLLGLLPMAMQLTGGLLQNREANKLASGADQPLMQITPEMKQALGMARTQASQVENPYASMERQQLGANVSEGTQALERGSTSGTDILGGVTQLANQEQAGLLGIGQQNIDYKQKSDANLVTMLQNMANWKQKQWETNQYEPWKERMAASSALKGAGYQNIFGSAMTGAQTAMMMAGMTKQPTPNAIGYGYNAETAGPPTMDDMFKLPEGADLFAGTSLFGGGMGNAGTSGVDLGGANNIDLKPWE